MWNPQHPSALLLLDMRLTGVRKLHEGSHPSQARVHPAIRSFSKNKGRARKAHFWQRKLPQDSGERIETHAELQGLVKLRLPGSFHLDTTELRTAHREIGFFQSQLARLLWLQTPARVRRVPAARAERTTLDPTSPKSKPTWKWNQMYPTFQNFAKLARRKVQDASVHW